MAPPLATRELPPITDLNGYFWTSGRNGALQILRCSDCGHYIHPYAARCPKCRSAAVAPEAVSGRGQVAGFTVNHQPWIPGVPTPYVVAIVELEEQSDLRLMTNMPRTPIEKVRIGLPVQVFFEQVGEAFVPLFETRGE